MCTADIDNVWVFALLGRICLIMDRLTAGLLHRTMITVTGLCAELDVKHLQPSEIVMYRCDNNVCVCQMVYSRGMPLKHSSSFVHIGYCGAQK